MKDLSIPMLVAQVMRSLLDNTDMRRATYYADPKLVISICRRHKFSKRNLWGDFVVKVGRPNYIETKFVALCKKAKEPFPVKRVQLKAWPKKRNPKGVK
jgi:predicted Co/Zn/Cd cation transporter (cation efflux family)